ncbi:MULTISPECIES: hypothetical protein [unclassified Pseudomonas]|uniref:hypothetical protein n=1 Tax=unclassified Pseudomonas TaxID=196821 RepID=UPI0013022577|nr:MULTISPECIES: hypothetical protein [unclassified Pseudomonas]
MIHANFTAELHCRHGQIGDGWLGLYGTHVAGRIIDAFNPANLLRNRMQETLKGTF